MQLFPDQLETLSKLRAAYRAGARAPLLVAPTGFGKTVLFSEVAKGAASKGSRIWILVHRTELIDQVSDTLTAVGAAHGIVSPDAYMQREAQIQVCSVFTLTRRLDRLPRPDLVIIDEAHHVIPGSTWGRVLDHAPNARRLGVTATPLRLSGEGLDATFDTLILGPTAANLISTGRLSSYRCFAPPIIDATEVHTRMGDYVKSELETVAMKTAVVGDSIDHYKKLADGKRAAVFCVSVDHARSMSLAANEAGIPAVMIDGKLDKGLRRDCIAAFRHGKIRWLVTCDLISEGFDCPGIEVGIFLRPTQSLGLWMQQAGRCLRTAPGKTEALLLDHSGNALRHGLPSEPREWSLQGIDAKKHKREREQSVRVCPKCFSAQFSGKSTCGECGHVFAVQSRKVHHIAGELVELTQDELALRRRRQDQGRATTLDALVAIGTQRGMKNPHGWARHVMMARMAKGRSYGN